MPQLMSLREFLNTARSADISAYKKTGKLPSYVKGNPSSTRRNIVKGNTSSTRNPSSIRRNTTEEERKKEIKRRKEQSIRNNPSDFDLKTGARLTEAEKHRRRIEARKKLKTRMGKTFKKGGSVKTKRSIGPAGASTVSKDGRRMKKPRGDVTKLLEKVGYGKTVPGGLKSSGKDYTARERAITRAGVGGTGIQRAILALRRLKKGKPQPHGPSTKKSPITKQRRAKRPGVRGTGRGAKARRS